MIKNRMKSSIDRAVNCDVDIDAKAAYFQPESESCPFRGWHCYFPNLEYGEVGCEMGQQVEAILDHIKSMHQVLLKSHMEERKMFCFDYDALCSSPYIRSKWPTFKQDLLDKPTNTLGCLGLALFQFTEAGIDERTVRGEVGAIVRARLSSIDNMVPFKNIKAGLYGKLVGVTGTVVRVEAVRLRCEFLTFQCSTCRDLQSLSQPDGVYRFPTSCPGTACRSRSFVPVVSSRHTKTTSCQLIKLQEKIDDDWEGGRVPRIIECELSDDLVDSCGPSDSITLIGIVKAHNRKDGGRRGSGKGSNLFTLYLEAISVVSSKGKVLAARNRAAAAGIEFSLRDYYAIQEIQGHKNCWKLLVNSVCPSVYGHEMVKAGMLLSLLGGASCGSSSQRGATTRGVKTRGNAHVLVVGDPGLGKSHMLHAAAAIALRGVYICGNTTSSSGLTVTLRRESGGGFALDAGALVLADRGVCCIDEFDKMTSHHQALLEALEQQRISIAKGGVVCSLPARTTVIAAANPAGGHYNRNKTLTENLKMGQPLLSRFDLVFILLDKPDEQIDRLLSEHVMALHSGNRSADSTLNFAHGSAASQLDQNFGNSFPLSQRLKIRSGETMQRIPCALLRKYIVYARKYVSSPRLSKRAAAVLQDFYLELRKIHRKKQWTPVTTRQLESFIRLTQARAKAELREEAEEGDAKDVVELVRWSMMDTYSDESGALHFTRSQNGSGLSGRSKVKRFLSALQTKGELEGRNQFSLPEMRDLGSAMNLNLPDFFAFISSLNSQGFLLKKQNNLYQLLSI